MRYKILRVNKQSRIVEFRSYVNSKDRNGLQKILDEFNKIYTLWHYYIE